MAKRMPGTPPVIGGYSYLRPLGAGGFADVFLYDQDMPRRSVAVKVMLADVVDPAVIRMFNAEADVMARLSAHPSILTVYDASVSADGRPFLVMEYCPGSYGTRYRREQISVAEVLRAGIKIGSALATAHQSGLLHRDVKPSNILVTSFGAPVLSDFGIASSLMESTANQVIGMSVPWSAPEVIAEKTLGTVSSEIYSLAATLFTLLVGRSPAEIPGEDNSRTELAARIMKGRISAIERSDVPVSLRTIIAGGLAKNPERRPESMAEFVGQLQNAERELGIAPTPAEMPTGAIEVVPAAVEFDDSRLRGPVRSTVAHQSSRPPKRRPVFEPVPPSPELQAAARPRGALITTRALVATIAVASVTIVGLLILVVSRW